MHLEKNCKCDFSFKQSRWQMQCQAHVELECLRAVSSPMKVYLIMAVFGKWFMTGWLHCMFITNTRWTLRRETNYWYSWFNYIKNLGWFSFGVHRNWLKRTSSQKTNWEFEMSLVISQLCNYIFGSSWLNTRAYDSLNWKREPVQSVAIVPGESQDHRPLAG